MKHPKDEAWSDYVRGTADPARVEALEGHLGTGCSECTQRVSALRSVYRVGRIDRELEVPPAALRAAHNLFRIQRLFEAQATSRRSLSIAFDSLLAPATGGVRSAGVEGRHLVYESDAMTIDLQIEPASTEGGISIVGQVRDSTSSPVAEVPAFVHFDGRIVSQDTSGAMGDFSLQGTTTGASRVCFVVDDDQLVELELPSSPTGPSFIGASGASRDSRDKRDKE